MRRKQMQQLLYSLPLKGREAVEPEPESNGKGLTRDGDKGIAVLAGKTLPLAP
jgi:hypothetical protein